MLNYPPNKNYSKSLPQGVIALALASILIPACTDTQKAVLPKENITAAEVVNETTAIAGESVTVRGFTTEMVGQNAFTMVTDEQLFDRDEILIVNATGRPFNIPNNKENISIQVTGEVRNFKIAEVERDFNLDLQPSQYTYTDYENQPVIIAKSLALAPEPEAIRENPRLFYNQPILVEGEVGEILGANAFTLDEEELLVLGMSAPARPINEGETVVVTGEIRPLIVADIERDYNLAGDLELKRKLEKDYKNQPVFIADNIFPSAQ
ncbi:MULTISPECIES: hypothetical protein [unclassified Coleofasciculus]|uniref:hypothetical protein n=1 Tax=unclassified Coleofasciculus TaxID=2692782 RepID=UPI00188114CF|nr:MULTISPECIES: hypothetical protein [unclassified Coleofasciculus]MBE9128292.1 hypothetical protein [Coleofasciculus sp. LEGE 07081]MBE9151340.1 hypothetical protein [Coleofasciculus sp. LEGE 07092]